jgi:hypothetical protein
MRKHGFASPLRLLLLPALCATLAAAPVLAAVPTVSNTVSVTATNGFTENGDGTMTVTTAVQTPIPTLSVAGLAALAALLAAFGFLRMRRHARQGA